MGATWGDDPPRARPAAPARCSCGRRGRWLLPSLTGAGAGRTVVCGLHPHHPTSAVPPANRTSSAAGPVQPEDVYALGLLLAAERSYTSRLEADSYAWATGGPTAMHGVNLWQQVAVNWRTVRRLLDDALVDVELVGGRWDTVRLTSRGRAIAGALPAQQQRRVGAWARQRMLDRIRRRDRRRCQAPGPDGPCGQPAYYVDHVVPPSLGGTSTPDNLATVCTDCLLRRRQDRQP